MIEPDLSSRSNRCVVEKTTSLSPDVVFKAWTTNDLERWFASPGTLSLRAEVDAPFFFETLYEGKRHPHYGRFLRLEPDCIKLTWITAAGTKGEETVVTIELQSIEEGTRIRLTHEGFPDEQLCAGHEQAWPNVLQQLEDALTAAT